MRPLPSGPLIAYVLIILCVTNYTGFAAGMRAQPEDRPDLPEAIADEVSQLEQRIAEARDQFLSGSVNSLDDALTLARRALELRETHQPQFTDRHGVAVEWHEVADARRTLHDLQTIATLEPALRRELGVAWDYTRLEHLFNEGRFADAQALAESQRDVFTRAFGRDHPRALLALNDIGVTLDAQGRGGSEPYYRDALDGYRRALGNEHPKTLEAVYNLGAMLYGRGEYDESEQFIRESVDGIRHVRGPDHVETLRAVNNMAALLQARGKLADAERLYGEALDGMRRRLGDDHGDTIVAIRNMGAILQAQGQFDDAEPYFHESLERSRRTLGDDHPTTLSSLSWMGNILHRRGRYTEAEPYLRDALSGYRTALAADHALTMNAAGNLGSLLGWQGKYGEAQAYLEEAAEIAQRTLGPEHPSTFGAWARLGSLLRAKGELEAAETYATRTLDASRRVLGPEHPRTLRAMHDLGHVLLDQARTDEAESLWRACMEESRRVLGNDHPDTLDAIHTYGLWLETSGDLVGAEAHYREALRGRRATVGEAHSETLRAIRSLAHILEAQDRRAEAETHYREALALAQSIRGAATGGERGRAAMADRVKIRDLAASLAQLLALDGRHDEAWTIAEQGRGRALLDLLSRGHTDIESAVSDATELRRARLQQQQTRGVVSNAEARLAAMERERAVIAGQSSVSETDRNRRLATLDDALETQHDLILEARRDLREATAAVFLALHDVMPDAQPLSVTEIQPRLRPGDVVIGYIWSDRRVLASIATSTSVDGAFVTTSRETTAALHQRVDTARNDFANRPRDGASTASSREEQDLLAELIPTSIRDVIAQADRVIILPDGPLTSLPLEALAFGVERGVLDDGRQQIVYASSATVYLNRCAAALAQPSASDLTLLALGDPVFQRDPSTESDDTERLPDRSRGMDDRIARASLLDVVRVHGGTLPRLPGTRREVERIGALVDDDAILLLDEDATLNGLETSIEGVRYLHLATHGLVGSQDRPYDASLALTQPMIPDVDDIGFLTLDRLIRTWRGRLASCDLVTLSACDTQRGIRQGDALMSLPWGFYYAGAPSVVASLWQIDDEATSLLMTRFYENLLGVHDDARTLRGLTFTRGQPMPKADALQEAKRWLRTYEVQGRGVGRGPVVARGGKPDSRRPYAHPYYWAAFVLIGDPG